MRISVCSGGVLNDTYNCNRDERDGHIAYNVYYNALSIFCGQVFYGTQMDIAHPSSSYGVTSVNGKKSDLCFTFVIVKLYVTSCYAGQRYLDGRLYYENPV